MLGISQGSRIPRLLSSFFRSCKMLRNRACSREILSGSKRGTPSTMPTVTPCYSAALVVLAARMLARTAAAFAFGALAVQV